MENKNSTWIIVIILILLIIGGLLIYSSSKNDDVPNSNQTGTSTAENFSTSTNSANAYINEDSIQVRLEELNNSSEKGTAVIKQTDDNKTEVFISILGAPKNIKQPAHIHLGTCSNHGNIKYPLNDLLNGKSSTTLNVSLDEIMSQDPLSINVHKSLKEPDTMVSCGDIATTSNQINY